MKTVVIQIGNSDNKLTQAEWSQFVESVRAVLANWQGTTHFDACSRGDAPWQNACFVAEVAEDKVEWVIDGLIRVRMKYRQDSVAIVVGETQFI